VVASKARTHTRTCKCREDFLLEELAQHLPQNGRRLEVHSCNLKREADHARAATIVQQLHARARVKREG
jgi:hypothetical protein